MVQSGLQRTLMLIKPDAVEKGYIGAILNRAEQSGFRILDLRMSKWTPREASLFYAMHKGKPFFEGLVEFMSSGAVVGAMLERADAVNHLRAISGPTDSRHASEGTIRGDFGTDNRKNAVHASDSPQSAARELALFFGQGAGDSCPT